VGLVCFGGAIVTGVGGFVLFIFGVVSLGGLGRMAAISLVLTLVGLYFAAKAAERRPPT
jgi:hypothetical protein